MNKDEIIYVIGILFSIVDNWPILISASVLESYSFLKQHPEVQDSININISEKVNNYDKIWATAKLIAESEDEAIKKAKLLLLNELVTNKSFILEEGINAVYRYFK